MLAKELEVVTLEDPVEMPGRVESAKRLITTDSINNYGGPKSLKFKSTPKRERLFKGPPKQKSGNASTKILEQLDMTDLSLFLPEDNAPQRLMKTEEARIFKHVRSQSVANL